MRVKGLEKVLNKLIINKLIYFMHLILCWRKKSTYSRILKAPSENIIQSTITYARFMQLL